MWCFFVIGVWNLRFICNLVLGIWDFSRCALRAAADVNYNSQHETRDAFLFRINRNRGDGYGGVFQHFFGHAAETEIALRPMAGHYHQIHFFFVD